MLWTAFVWGFGVTAGGSVGVMLFVILFSGWQRLVNIKSVRQAVETADLSIALLSQRNDLTQQQVAVLERIAAAMEQADG